MDLGIRNTVKMIDSWKENEFLYIQMEKCQSDLLEITKKRKILEFEILKILREIANSLIDLHKNSIAHIDIKLSIFSIHLIWRFCR